MRAKSRAHSLVPSPILKPESGSLFSSNQVLTLKVFLVFLRLSLRRLVKTQWSFPPPPPSVFSLQNLTWLSCSSSSCFQRFHRGPWKLTPPSVNAQQTWLRASQTNQTGYALLGRRANKSSEHSQPRSTSLWRSDMRMRPRDGTGQVCHLWQVVRTIVLSGASANMAPAWMQLAIEQRISNIENVQTKDTSTVLSDPPGNPTPAASNAADSVRSGQLLCNLGTRRRLTIPWQLLKLDRPPNVHPTSELA